MSSSDLLIGFELDFISEYDLSSFKSVYAKNVNSKITTFESKLKLKEYLAYNKDTKSTCILYSSIPKLQKRIVTPFLSFNQSIKYLTTILKFIDELCTTNDKSNIKVKIKGLDSYSYIGGIDILKFILCFDENKVYSLFPERKLNYNARSIKNLRPLSISNEITDKSKIEYYQYKLPTEKYYAVNFNVVENTIKFKYLGGLNYEKNADKIIEAVKYFLDFSLLCVNKKVEITDSIRTRLFEICTRYNEIYDCCSDLGRFESNFKMIELRYDLKKHPAFKRIMIEMYGPKIAEFLILSNCRNGILNYNSKTQRLEIKGTKMKNGGIFQDIDIISSTIKGGMFKLCQMKKTNIEQSYLDETSIYSTEIKNCKLVDCFIDSKSKTINSEVHGELSYLNGTVKNTTIYNGTLGNSKSLELDSKSIVMNLNNQEMTNKEIKDSYFVGEIK